jgi:phospholipid/cholesterol/gamma-HCH transport system substrate-binding protein
VAGGEGARPRGLNRLKAKSDGFIADETRRIVKLSRDAQLGMKAIGVILAAIVAIVAVRTFLARGGADIVGVFHEAQLLARGNNVIYRGVKIGKVKEIRLSPRNDLVYVTMHVESGMRFPPDAAALIEPQALMGNWQVQIISQAWHPELEFPRVTRTRSVMPGAALASLTELTSVASRLELDIDTLSQSLTPAKIVQMHRTVDNAQRVSEQLREATAARGRNLNQAGGGVLAMSQGVQTLTRGVTTLAAGMRDSLVTGGSAAAMLANARTASANLAAFSAQLNAMAARSGATLRSADSSLTRAQRMSESLGTTARAMRPRVDSAGAMLLRAQQSMRTLEQAVAMAQQDTSSLGRLINDPAAYERTLRAVADVRRMLEDMQAHPERYLGKRKSF